MSQDRELEPGMRRTLLIALLICAVGFIGLTQLARHIRKAPPEPSIPVYPGAVDTKHWLIDQTGYQKLVFGVSESYPSTAVYDFYRRMLEHQGYTRLPANVRPTWELGAASAESQDYLLVASWADPKKLRVFELTITATEKLIRDPNTKRLLSREMVPGMQVVCVLSRRVLLGD